MKLTTEQLKADVNSPSMVELAKRGFLLRGAIDVAGLHKLVAAGAVVFVAVQHTSHTHATRTHTQTHTHTHTRTHTQIQGGGDDVVVLGHAIFTGLDEFLGYYDKSVNPNAHGVLVPRDGDGMKDWDPDRILKEYAYLYQVSHFFYVSIYIFIDYFYIYIYICIYILLLLLLLLYIYIYTFVLYIHFWGFSSYNLNSDIRF